MTKSEIFNAILQERIRQDELHPIVAKTLLPDCLRIGLVGVLAEGVKKENAISELDGTITWYDVFREELFEIFAETDPEKIKEEAIQLAALCVRLCETL